MANWKVRLLKDAYKGYKASVNLEGMEELPQEMDELFTMYFNQLPKEDALILIYRYKGEMKPQDIAKKFYYSESYGRDLIGRCIRQFRKYQVVVELLEGRYHARGEGLCKNPLLEY